METVTERTRGTAITLYLPSQNARAARAIRRKLDRIAAEYGFIGTAGGGVGRGNLAKLLIAIADGRLIVTKPEKEG